MRLPEQHLNATAFLCVEEGGQRIPKATAFFVADRSREGWQATWAVTARHCIQEIRASRLPSYLRINTVDSFTDIPMSPDDWHEATEHDVAVILCFPPPGAVLTSVPLDQFVSAEFTYQGDQLVNLPNAMEVQVGHEVFFVGLFSQHWGRERNLPIARFGAISRMPREPVRVERKSGDVERILGYLVEARSWGGHSGSPVFWTYPFIALHNVIVGINREQRRKQKPIRVQDPEARIIAFLGLVSAHFDIEAEIKGGDLPGATASINSGVMVVTPAAAIRDLLESEEVMEERDEIAREIDDQQPTATFDMARTVSADDDEFGRFEELTRELVNTPKPKPEKYAPGGGEPEHAQSTVSCLIGQPWGRYGCGTWRAGRPPLVLPTGTLRSDLPPTQATLPPETTP